VKTALLALCAIAAVFVQALPATHAAWTIAGVRPNLAFLFSLWAAMRLPLPAALLVPAVVGLTADLLSNARFGTYTLVFFLACLPASAMQRVLSFRLLPVFLVWALLLAILKSALETVVCLWTWDRFQAFAFVQNAALPEIIFTTLLALPFFLVLSGFGWLSHRVLQRLPIRFAR
jgi:rod shape-determining protein MreD